MGWRWYPAPGVGQAVSEALREAFRPERIAPMAAGFDRRVKCRGYGCLAATPQLPGGVFVKVFEHDTPWRRLRHALGRSGAAREFGRAVRLWQMGVPTPQPLARVDEVGPLGCRTTYLLTEFAAGARSLREVLQEVAGPHEEAFRRTAQGVAESLAHLAARGIASRDMNCENVLVTVGADGGPDRVQLVDLRHVEFRTGPWPEAVPEMLVILAGTLLAAGVEERLVAALVEAAMARAGAEAGDRPEASVDGVLRQGREFGNHMQIRDIRKGKRPAADLNVVADHYQTLRDAVNYRDQRFARSPHHSRIERAERSLVERIVRDLGVRGEVLDVPCGSGRFFAALAAAGARVVGADIAAPMVELARGAAGTPVPCLLADARHLPFGDGGFDLVFAMRLLHRVPSAAERVAVLVELARVSRGWVLFSFYNRRTPRGLRDWIRRRYPGETRARIGRDVAEAGLRLVRFLPVAPLDRQTLVLCRAGGTE